MTESNVSDGEVEAAAQAIYDEPTSFDGDQIGVHLSQSMMIDGSASNVDELRALVMSVCRDASRAALRAAAKVRAIRDGDGEYVPHVIRYDSAEAGDPYWEFIDADTVAVIAPMRAANVELMYDLVDRSKVIGMRVYDPASPLNTPTDNLETGAGDLVERSEVNRILQEAFGKDTVALVLRIADLEAALDEGPSNPWRFWSDKANTLAAQLSAVTAENARLREALEAIRELNTTDADENGHRWAHSDLVDQEIFAAISQEAPK